MGTESIRHLSRPPTSVHNHLATLRSPRLTQLLGARVDSLEPREALPWSARISSHSAPTERTSPSARSATEASPLRAPLTDSGPASRGEAIGAEVSDPFLQAPASLLLHNRRLCGGLADEVHFYAAITEDEWQ